MTKKTLYFLIGAMFSFFISKKGQATDLDHTIDHFLSSSKGVKKTMGATHLPPLGSGEIALWDRYQILGVERDIHKVRIYLMPWIYKGVNTFLRKADFWFDMPIELAEGLYQDYKPIYDAFREAYEQDSEKGQNLFVNKAVSQFKIDEAYARTLYDALKPSPFVLKLWQDYKQVSSSSSSSSSSAAAATPPQETAEDQLKKLLLNNTLTLQLLIVKKDNGC